MKLKIKCIQNPLWVTSVWRVEFNGKVEEFNSPQGAQIYAAKISKRYFKEQAAYSMIMSLATNQLSNIERDFYNKIYQTQCKGITKKQYGYLKGIHERQQREW